MGELKFESFENVMHNKIVIVPDYQRDYSWGNTELATLADDLASLYEHHAADGEGRHFMGSIVLTPLDESISRAAGPICSNPRLSKYRICNIIDGQQRISTISVLLMAIRDYAEQHGVELEEKQHVESMLATGQRDEDGRIIPVLHFSQENTQQCFNSMLFRTEPGYDHRRAGARRLLAAKQRFDEEIERLFDGDHDVARHLNDYIYLVLYSLQIVEIDCGQDSDAFQIFESLNATGVPLTPAEQVKNLVLMRSEKTDVSLSVWEKVVEAVGEDSLVEFLAQFMFCKENQRVSRKEIYRKFKEVLKASSVTEVLEKMGVYASLYRQLKEPAANLSSARALQDLDGLGQRQAYVPLLLAADRFGVESKDFAAIADAILVFIVRHQVCSQSTNKLDIIFSEACEVIKNEAKRPEDIIAFFKSAQMADGIFKEMFRNLSFPYAATAQRKALVYLRRIEEKAKGVNNPLQIHAVGLSVEHIIPKQPSIELLEGWIGEDEADALRDSDPKLDDFSEEVIMSIGNLLLLHAPENSSAGNRGYREKRGCYERAMQDEHGESRGIPAEVFTLVAELLEDYPDVFDAKCVRRRAEHLAEQAVVAWR